MTIKALTLTQPWATLVALGHKQIETRSWYTAYRGPLAIHAAKGYPKEAREFTSLPEIFRLLDEPGQPFDMPFGGIVAVCRLYDVRIVEEVNPGPKEALLGNYSAGRYGWLLKDVNRVWPFQLVRGSLGLWDWEVPEHLHHLMERKGAA